MLDYSLLIRKARSELGLTQATLAHRSGLSVPSIQNIEAGHGNPALATLDAVFAVLGLELRCEARAMDWNLLAVCGAPLLTTKQLKSQPPTQELLVQSVAQACSELTHKKDITDRERKEDSLRALLLALKLHFPRFYSKHFINSPLITAYTPQGASQFSGRLIKLKRQALSVLAEYL